MGPFRIHILGCGSALPTLNHYASSQIVEIREKLFMIDCGEGTQMQLRRSKIRFTKLRSVFISHLHGDHCFGLIGTISTFGMLGRTAPLHVYAPEAFEPILQGQLDFFCKGLEFKVEFHAVDTLKNDVIYEDQSLTIETIPLEHRIPTCGFLFREKPRPRHINREMTDCYEVPLCQLNNIRNGMDWTTPEGIVIANERLTTPADPPRAYAYCSDTRYIPTLHELVAGVDTLYHESTYAEDNLSRARLYWHSTARQAATVARDAHVGKLLLGHFSARYEDETCILDEAKQVFENSWLTNEGFVFDV
ncbi:MAG: ribonuclease Z [Segatella maculosa]